MEQIIINTRVAEERPKYRNTIQKVSAGKFFEDFVDSQRQSESKPKGLSPEAVARFREETYDVMAHCNPHDAPQNPETTHLVVGYVQSGKTMSFTGLTALAKDMGYKIIIYLAGTKNNLLDQTTKRLRKDLIGPNGKNNDYYKIHANPTTADIDDIIGNLESINHPIVLIPILKHYDHILKVRDILNDSELKGIMQNETIMIIDDEADQASLNSYGRRNSQYDEDEKSKTYDSILKLRAELAGNTFIQYTATPQANILISMQDMLSPKSHTLLTPGEDYVGGKLFFGQGKDHKLYNGGLIIKIPDNQVFHKKKNPLKTMPQSLKDALMLHIMAIAIVVYYHKVEGINYLSMMVHPDNTKEWNRKFKEWIDNELKMWRKLLHKADDHEDKIKLLDRFKELYPLAIKYYDAEEQPNFSDIEIYILEILNNKKVYLVNTDKDAQTNIEWDDYKMHVLVGAEMLNRGFTVEKLATTYMPRYYSGAANADTIQQRCRFFGYKMDYIKSCRVFLPAVSIINYLSYIKHEEELRSTLATCDTLEAAERKVLLSPNLRPTRSNILPIWVVNTKLTGMHGLQAFASRPTIEHNDRLVEVFLKKHENDWIIRKGSTPDRTHRWFKLKVDDAIQFLSDFSFKNWTDAQRKADTIRYLRYLSAEDNANPIKYVYFYQMAYQVPFRERAFDPSTNRLDINTSIFAGPSSAGDSTDYPGDARIYGDGDGNNDSITIQLYHIGFKPAPLDFPRQAYTLAIYYPVTLAANYCSSEKSEIDESEEDDEL